jgi:hypothetical protein
VVALVLPWVALADDVSNNLDASIDATAEVMNLVQGGSNGSTTLFVNPTNGDGKNGCNLTSSTTLTVSVNTSDASVATVSPTSVTFNACGATNALTVTPHNSGSATISLGLVSNNTAGTFNLAPAAFTVNVAPAPPTDTTAPSIVPTITGTLGNNGWYTSDVMVSWTVTDDESTISSSTGCTSTTISTDTNGTTLTCTATSAGGTSTQSVTIQRDATAPSVTCTVPNQISWYGADVTVNCTASDGVSGLANSADASFTLSTSVPGGTETDNASTTSRVVSDNAGNTATAGPYIFKVDLKGPVVVCGSADGVWHATDVTIACTATDDGSGLANPADASFNLSTSVASGTETNNASTNSYSVIDNVGNASTAGPISGNWVDKKAPVVSCGSADGVWHGSNVSIGCTATDDGSGLADSADTSFNLTTTVASGNEDNNAATGSHSVVDKVGNSATAGPISGNMIDLKAPTVVCGSADGVWHASNVSITCTASDHGSGLMNPSDASFSLTTNVANGDETNNASTSSYDVVDVAGNTTTAGPISGNMVDKKAPVITINAPTGTTYVLGQGVAADYGCTDGGSLVASCNGTVSSGSNIDTASVGSKTFSVSATDNVGNMASSSVSYSVAYASGGTCLDSAGHQILQPINLDGSSVFKQGSTIPAKFRVCDANGNSIGTPGVVSDFKLIKKTNGTSSDTNEAVVSTSADSAFRWDPGAQQWIFNVSTKNLSKGYTYTYQITLNDGSNIQFTFGLK